jgi:hydrogenase nickel incorporation protein HypB
VRTVEVKKGILSKNDRLAKRLRQRYEEAGVFTLNLVSSPGTGKTELLQRTLRELSDRGLKVAALVGDLQTDNDALRLQKSGAPVRQITTSGLCHLEAQMVEDHLQDWDLANLDFLFVENVGNLVCPSSFDLGEQLRIALLSVTEGEDKPLKYPPIFSSAHLAIITKADLAEPCEFQAQLAHDNIRSVHPDIAILTTSARTGQGFTEWLDYLIRQRQAWLEEKKGAATV